MAEIRPDASLKARRAQALAFLFVGTLLALPLCGISLVWLRDGWARALRPYLLYRETRCLVLEKRLERRTYGSGDEAFFPRFKLRVLPQEWTAEAHDLWEEGLPREKAQERLEGTPAGQALPCWHPPERPAEAVLDRRPSSSWLLCGLFLPPMSLLLLGVAGLGAYDLLRLSAGR